MRALLVLAVCALVGVAGLTAIAADRSAPKPVTEPQGLSMRLSDAAPVPVEPKKPPVTTPLSDADLAMLLARLPPIEAKPADVKTAARPPQSAPPPRAGKTVLAPFPASEQVAPPPRGEAGPLSVLRRSPEGDVDDVAGVSVTFSQAMVPVATVGQVAREDVPVRLAPEPPGRWRWIDSRTVSFQPEGGRRMPKATRYEVEVPAATRSEVGGALGAAEKWTFATPAPTMVGTTWQGANPWQPPIAVLFDQRVDARRVLEHVRLRAGTQRIAVEPVDLDAKGEDAAAVREWLGANDRGRIVAFRATRELPHGAGVAVTIGAGTPSEEGPLVTSADQTFDFQTPGPLRVVGHECGWGDGCRPGSPLVIDLSNVLDADAFDPASVKVTPAIDDLNVTASGVQVWIQGATTAGTRYVVTLPAALRDAYGQTLGKPMRVAFDVGASQPDLSMGPDRGLVVLPPSPRPTMNVQSTGLRSLRVRLWPVEPNDWDAARAAVRRVQDKPGEELDLPGHHPIETQVRVSAGPDVASETAIDLTPALHSGLGHVLVDVAPSGERPDSVRDAVAWVEVTNIGLDALADGDQLSTWATGLTDGAPLEGVALTLEPDHVTATTDSGGLASLALPATDYSPLRGLVARRGDDVAFLPEQPAWGGGWTYSNRVHSTHSWWTLSESLPALVWHVLDDRGLYRPGEAVHVKGWIRRVGFGKGGDVEIPLSHDDIAWTLSDQVGNELSKGTAPLSSLAAFDFTVPLPEGMNLGLARVDLATTAHESTTHTFRVEEFRRPEYEVVVSPDGAPSIIGDGTTLTAAATYYAGGGLANADITWNIVARRGEFRPPHWDDFSFGRWRPWWREWYEPREERTFTHSARTDAAGEHRLRLDFESVNPIEPTSVTAEATVMDVNRQAWSARTQLVVHPASLYVGVRLPKAFVARAESLPVEAVVTDLDGKAVTGREVVVRAARLGGRMVAGKWTETEEDVVDCRVTSGDAPVPCSLALPKSGAWRLTASVTDERGRRNETTLMTWVAGAEPREPREIADGELEIVPDKKEYRGGDVARLLVRSPFAPAEALLVIERGGIVSEKRLRLEESSTVVEVPVDAAWTPAANAEVLLVGTDPNGKDPAFARGSVRLAVPPRERALTVDVTPRESVLAPHGSTILDVRVTDASGAGATGEVTVIVVDEAVLALAGYELFDPLTTFYPFREPGVDTWRLRQHVLRSLGMTIANAGGGLGGRVEAADTAMAEMVVVMKGGAKAMRAAPAPMATYMAGAVPAASPAIALRSDLTPLALFAPAVPLDADGRASVPLTLPDSLTRYRVMAIAVSGVARFGKGESSVTARKPLMVRPSAPRFLNVGDRFELPVVVQNQTDTPMTADVAIRTSNMAFEGSQGLRVTLAPDDREELRFALSAARPGIARLQAVAASGALDDAAELSFPTWTPATSEAFATYGTLDAGSVVQPVARPTEVLPEFGGLSVTTSSTALHELGDAVVYLEHYPYGCSEQLASRVLGIAALREALGAFSQLPPKAALDAAMQRDIATLVERQRSDGSFGLWRKDGEREEWPGVSVHAARALRLASVKGWTVPDAVLERSRDWLRNVRDHVPERYGAAARQLIEAEALHVRFVAGDVDPAAARRLASDAGGPKLPLEAVAWLLPTLASSPKTATLASELKQRLLGRVSETAGAASFGASSSELGDDAYLVFHSDKRIDAIALEALLDIEPSSDLAPKLVRGLLDHRVAGRWENTQENAFVLLALGRYFEEHERAAPSFEATAWLGPKTVLHEDFRGRSTTRRETLVPMADLLAGPAQQDVVIAKEGSGRLYWRLGLSYAPSSLRLPPADQGFEVERSYEGVTDPGDVRRDTDGTWHVRAGALVRVRVRMAAPARRTHVALVDPLPAGLEILDSSLAASQQVVPGDDSPRGPGGIVPLTGKRGGPIVRGPWTGTWFEHENLRDDRAEAFASMVSGGEYIHEHACRATTPGRFIVPPAKAEEMYHPETFGRSGTDVIVIE